jgi:hypothetical protein
MMDILLDKALPLKVRMYHAEAILMLGKIFQSVEMDPSQPPNDGYQFEELLAKTERKRLMTKNGSYEKVA